MGEFNQAKEDHSLRREFLCTATFAEVLLGERRPSTGLPAKGQQGQRHSAHLQKPGGKLLQGRGMRGKPAWDLLGTSQLLSLLLPPCLDTGTPLLGDR